MSPILNRRNVLAGAAATIAAPGLVGSIIAPDGVEADMPRDDSLWTSELPPLPSFPTFEGDQKADLVIVGAGYTGLSCAYYVKKLKPDWRVIVLDSHHVGSGASSRNSGAVYARHVGISDQDFSDRGFARFVKFMETENIDCDFGASPTLMLLNKDSDIQTKIDSLQPGEKWVSATELRERGATAYYAGAVESPGYFSIHPAKLYRGKLEAVRRLGVEIYENSAALEVEKTQPALVKLSNGLLRARHVFIATNAYTPRLGIQDQNIFPVHQYSLATRQLSAQEITGLGLTEWPLRFEKSTLPVTFSLTPSGHFFVRMVIGYASFNSGHWADLAGAKTLATKVFLQRYPVVADLKPDFGWHGVTGHTAMSRPVFESLGDGNIHVSAAYNGLGIMPGHNSGYLSACKITGKTETDVAVISAASSHIPLPGEFYRSILFKPFMSAATPV